MASSSPGCYAVMDLCLTPEECLSGAYAVGILQHRDGKFSAWTRTWEGPARPDRLGAMADLRDRVPWDLQKRARVGRVA